MTIISKALRGISMPQFYKWGTILFSMGLIGAGINTKMQWASINIGGKISMVSSFFFQALFLALFLTLYLQTRKEVVADAVVNNPELDNFIKELQSEDKIMKGGSKKWEKK